MKQFIDLNCDLGESFGVYTLGRDREIITKISSANIACGFHAGDPLVMKETVSLARENGVGIGAHPGFRDLLGFGRRPIQVKKERLKQEVIYQLGALGGIAKSQGLKLQHVKPHGSLNNLAAEDKGLARTICEAVLVYDEHLIFVAPGGTKLYEAAREMGITVASEFFADRAYNSDGNLVPRGREGAVLKDPQEIVDRVLRMLEEGHVETVDGKTIEIQADTICVHGDNSTAVEITTHIHTALTGCSVEITPLKLLLPE